MDNPAIDRPQFTQALEKAVRVKTGLDRLAAFLRRAWPDGFLAVFTLVGESTALSVFLSSLQRAARELVDDGLQVGIRRFQFA